MKKEIYLKGFAEALIPYLMPYIENKIKDELSNLPNHQRRTRISYQKTGDV